MKASARTLLHGALAGGALLAYAALAHYSSLLPEAGHWAVALAAAPLVLVALGLARHSPVGALATLALLAALAWAWPRLQHNLPWLYFLQHLGVNAGLGLLFGRSLLGGRQPLCGVFASVLHASMSPALIRYTRQVTVAWTLFFAAMASVSALLFFLASAEAWSVFANLLTLPLVALMFIAENAVRKRQLPAEDQHGILGAIRAYRQAMGRRGGDLLGPGQPGR